MNDRRPPERPERDALRGGPAPNDAADDAMAADAAQAERFAAAWTAVTSGTPLPDVLAELADDAELASLVRLAAKASVVLPASVGETTRARQAAVLRALVPAERRDGRAAARTPGAAADARDGRRRHGVPAGRPATDRSIRARWLGGRPQLLLRLSAAVLAVAVGVGSSVVVSADDVPGDALYGVKRAAESARMALIFDPGRRAAFHLELAEVRIAEIRALINRGRNPSARIVEALIAQLSSAGRDAASAQDRALIESVRMARDAAARSLGELAGQAPKEAARVLNSGIAALAPVPLPSTGRPDAHAPPRGERGRPSPTVDVAAVPTDVEAGGGDAVPPASPTDRPTTALPPYVAAPTVAAATAPAGDAPPPGGPPGAGEGSLPPSGGAAAPTSAPPAQATEVPPPPVEAPTQVNPFAGQRATALISEPPPATKVPSRTPKRP